MRLRRLWLDLLGLRPRHLQVAALCLRRQAGREEVLLVTSRGRGRWILPKGWPMAGRDLPGSALQEAWEEAGVHGVVTPECVGRYHYANLLQEDFAQEVEVRVFAIHEVCLSDDYPEAGQRERRWWALPEAAEAVSDPELAALLRKLASNTPST